MTAVARPRRGIVSRPTNASWRRIRRLSRNEFLLLRRFHVLTATAVVTALWSVVLAVTPAGARQVIAPLVLLTDVTALSFLFVPALLLLERTEGVELALAVTPTRRSERVGVRVGLLTWLSLLAGAVIIAVSGLPHAAPRLLGIAMLGALFGLVATAVVGRATTLTTFLTRAPLVAVPLIAPALLYLLGLADTPALYVSPVTSAVDLLHGRMHWAGLTWQAVSVIVCAVVISRSGSLASASPRIAAVRRFRPGRRHPDVYTWQAAVGSFARTDRRTLVRDGLLVMLVCSVPLVALIMRVIVTVGPDWAQQRYGVALTPYLPLVEVVLLVIHTPVIFGSLAGLLLLEDRDAGLFGPLAATRATVTTLLAYRLAATVAVTTTTLALSLPLTGVGHPAGTVGHLSTAIAAGGVSVVPPLLMTALATNRVQGVAVMKILGLPLYLPIATWFLADTPARWLFAPLPTSWAAWAAWAPTPVQAVTMTAGAVLVTAAVAAPLSRRFLLRATNL